MHKQHHFFCTTASRMFWALSDKKLTKGSRKLGTPTVAGGPLGRRLGIFPGRRVGLCRCLAPMLIIRLRKRHFSKALPHYRAAFLNHVIFPGSSSHVIHTASPQGAATELVQVKVVWCSQQLKHGLASCWEGWWSKQSILGARAGSS